MAAAYSSCGRTRIVLAASLTLDVLVLIFLFKKPRVLWALPVIPSMCEHQDKLLGIHSTSNSLQDNTMQHLGHTYRLP